MARPKPINEPLERTQRRLERQTLTALKLRGAVRLARDAPRVIPSYEDILQAAGNLRRILKITGETLDAVCARLRIHGETRRRIQGHTQGATKRLRLKPYQVAAAYGRRKPLGITDEERDQRRAVALGLEYGSPEWDDRMAKERAWLDRLHKLRASAGPVLSPGDDQRTRETKLARDASGNVIAKEE